MSALMDLKISYSSLREPPIMYQRCSQSLTHVNRLLPITNKPTTKDSKCSTNTFIRPIRFHGESRFPKSLFGQHKRNSILACAKHEFAGSDQPVLGKAQPEFAGPNSVSDKVIRFGSICYTFIRPYAMLQVITSATCFFARVMVENRQLFKWSLLFKAFPGLVAMILAHAFTYGINQIFDADIDRVNKPYLPIPAGDISLKQAWFSMIAFLLGGQLILRLMNADLITTCLYCVGLLMAFIYSAPPLRLKGSSIGTIILVPLSTIVNNVGVLYATIASLGLPFRLSPPIVFMLTFNTLFFVVTCIIKDIPDIEGDIKHNVRTFAATFGPRNMTFLALGILLVNYVGAITASIYMPQAFKRYLMLPTHIIFALWSLFQARKLDKANYGKEECANFYEFLWKLLTLEFLLLPFI